MAAPARAQSAAPAAREILGPSWFTECLIYHNAFEGKPADADVNAEKIAVVDRGPVETAEAGFIGRSLSVKDWRNPFQLRSPALSPHRPLTLSFWWALPYDLAIDGGYSLFSINGKGMVAAFCRGKGEWCALQRPAGVFQVYYFNGIQNVNGIYDGDLLVHLDLKKGVWHHTAVVFRRGCIAQMYTDGKLVFEVTTSGREFRADDALNDLSLGGPLYVDELSVLNRSVDGDMIAEYYQGMSRLREYCR